MKAIKAILAEFGLEPTEEQMASIEKAVGENYRTVTEYGNQAEKLAAAEEKVTTLTTSLDKFKDVDPDALNQTITDLKDQLTKKDSEYAEKIAARDFEDVLREAITGAKGRNVKAIRALLDLDALRASKNQKEDVVAAVKKLTEAEDSSFLFASADDGEGTDDNQPSVGKVDAIGTVKTEGSGDSFYAGLRSSMGLPSSNGTKKE